MKGLNPSAFDFWPKHRYSGHFCAPLSVSVKAYLRGTQDKLFKAMHAKRLDMISEFHSRCHSIKRRIPRGQLGLTDWQRKCRFGDNKSHLMETPQKELFISYKREETSTRLANTLMALIQAHFPFLKVMLDDKEVRTGASIRSFMDRLTKGNYIIFLISPSFLKSDWCMYELALTADYEDFRERIFHIRFPEVEISTSLDVINVSEYWQGRWQDLKTKMDKMRLVNESHLANEFEEELRIAGVIVHGSGRALLHLRQTIGLKADINGEINYTELLAFMDGWVKAPASSEPAQPQLPPPIQQLLDNMLPIPATTYTLGAAPFEDTPPQPIALQAYQLSRTPVTQAQWQAVMGSNPSHFQSEDAPVECVNWHDCQAFLTQLNALTGCQFRLPTEAEWEYAATATPIPAHELATVAAYDATAQWQSQPVGMRPANHFGLQDMLGNVFEWCQDLDTATHASPGEVRVIKGGAWLSHPNDLDPHTHHNELATTRHPAIGLRLAHNALSRPKKRPH